MAIALVDNKSNDYKDADGREQDDYIEINVSQGSYTVDEQGESTFTDKKFELHRCSEEEVGLDESGNSKFYPIIDEDKNALK